MALSSRLITRRPVIFGLIIFTLLIGAAAAIVWLDDLTRTPLEDSLQTVEEVPRVEDHSAPSQEPLPGRANPGEKTMNIEATGDDSARIAVARLLLSDFPPMVIQERLKHIFDTLSDPTTCEATSLKMWIQYLEEKNSEPIVQGLRTAEQVHRYIDDGCVGRVHHGDWSKTTELIGVGIMAETLAASGVDVDARATQITQTVATAFDILSPTEACEAAVPYIPELRSRCLTSLRRIR